jgi:alpha-L-fucosidase 2
LAKLLPYQIGKYGQLQEWAEDFEDSEKEHRHVSHLYALHPSNQISVQHTPELAAAARQSMERRGDEATGWSMGWKVNLWARLLDGERAFKLITRLFTLIRSNEQKMTGGGTYPNLFDAHPPFQIDGNFGVTAGIAEMLIQSQNDEIVLLPALPSAWKNGSITGLKARGGVEVSIFWQNGQLEKTVLKASKSGVYTIRYGTTVKNIELQAGKIFIL